MLIFYIGGQGEHFEKVVFEQRLEWSQSMDAIVPQQNERRWVQGRAREATHVRPSCVLQVILKD